MIFSLYLYPSESHRPFTIIEFAEFFHQLEFGTKTDNTDKLLAGPRLMEYITYLGCSPALTPAGSEIHLHQFSQLTGRGGNSIETLRYPRCRHNIPDPPALLSLPPSATWHCEQCNNSGLNSEINWRKCAAYSDFFIEITSIFPKEAIPAEQFIRSINEFSDTSWSWFYAHSSMS